jgi:hypothetical protein
MKAKGQKGSKTLNLDGIIPELEEDEQAYEGLNQRAQAFIHEIGMRLPEQPMTKDGEILQPTIPRNPDGSPSLEPLDLTGLTNLYAEMLAYQQYANTQFGHLEIEKLALKEKLELLESKLLILLPPPEATKKARIRTDSRYKKLKRQLTECLAKIALLSKLVAGVDEEMKLVSREITIRTTDVENIKRESNAGRRRGGGGRGGIPGGRRVR